MAEPLKKEVVKENEALKERLQEMEAEQDRLSGLVAIHTKRPGSFEPMEHGGEETEIGMLEPGEQPVMTENGLHIGEAIETSRLKDVKSPEFSEKMAYEKFMQEPVTIMIHSTNEENPMQVIEISVNGRSEIFEREKPKTVRRMFVEGLARAKPTKYRNEEFVQNDGIRSVRWPSTSGLRYPFSVVQDNNPKGPLWLRAVLSQP